MDTVATLPCSAVTTTASGAKVWPTVWSSRASAVLRQMPACLMAGWHPPRWDWESEHATDMRPDASKRHLSPSTALGIAGWWPRQTCRRPWVVAVIPTSASSRLSNLG